MPERAWAQEFTPLGGTYEMPQEVAPTLGETFGAAFRMENDVVAAYRLLNPQESEADDDFGLLDQLKNDGVEPDGWNDYIGVRSYNEYKQRQAKIEAEMQDRKIIAESGGYGVVAQIAAGALSPTILIPIIGGATRVKSAASAAFTVAGSTVLQEAALLADQQTRTTGEAAFSVAASAVLGGILGGALHFGSKAEIDKVVSDMVVSPSERYGLQTGTALSSQAVPSTPSAGKFAPALGMDIMSRMGPVTRGIQQPHAPKVGGEKIESAIYRSATSQFGDAGLVLQGNQKGIAAAPGGAIEDLVVQYNAFSADAVMAFEKHYNDYFFDSAVPFAGKGVRTILGKSGKLNKSEFATEVSKTIWSGKTHDVNQVNLMAAKVKEIIDALGKEGNEVKIFDIPEDTDEALKKLMGDASYLTRDFLIDNVNKGYNKFLDILTTNFQKKLDTQFHERWVKFQEKQAKTHQLIDDLSTGEEEAQKILADLRLSIGTMEKATPGVAEIDEEVAAITAKAAKEQDKTKLKALRAQRKDLIKQQAAEFPEYKVERAALARRLHNITRSRGLQKVKQRKKLAAIERNEEAALKVMNRAVRKGQKLLKLIQSTTSSTVIKKALKDFKESFELAADVYRKGEEKIAKFIASDDPDSAKLFGLQDMQDKRWAKLETAMARLNELEEFNQAGWKVEVQQALDDVLEPYADLVKRRGVREERLMEAARRADPKLVEARVAKLGKKVQQRVKEARDYWSGRTGKQGFDVDMVKGTADFSQYAKEIAEEVTDRVRHANGRLAWADLIREQRGPEYARVLDIPSMEIADFLETDINRLMVSYVKTVGADITVARKFGSANMKETFEQLLEEERFALQDLPHAINKKGEKLSKEEIEKASKEITDFYKEARVDLETLLMRVRHTRGVPEDPQSWATRGARFALNINTARMMGMVTVSSAADPARWVMKYGLTGVMRDGLMPMIKNFKTLKMNWREAKLAGTALDVVLHSRARMVFDVFDDTMRGSKFEKGVEWAATKIGLVGLFDYWTSAMKQFTSGLAVAKLSRSIEVMMSANPGKGELAKATTYLANKNITPDQMKIIWRNMTSGPGGGKVDDVWLPNTESWSKATPEDADALRAFRAALVSDIDDTIVTPGLERPSWVDANIPAKMLAQFKSFGLSSTFRTLMAGLQQHDMAFLNGIMISLALGALSYYLWARSTGGKAETEMENAGIEKWADEMISRSGVMGVFDEVQRAAQHVPFLQQVASFSGRPSTRREGGNVTEALLGPSFDLLEKMGGAVVNIDNNPEAAVHNARLMMPWQNVAYLRQGFDKIEQSIVNVFGLQKEAQ